MTAWIEDRTAALIAGLRAGALLADMARAGFDVEPIREAAARAGRGEPDPPPILVPWLSVEQAAHLLQMSTRTVERYCASGALAAQRHGGPRGTWRIDPGSVAAIILKWRGERHIVADHRLVS